MNKNDVKIGMKVVPFQKTVENWGTLGCSDIWRSANERKQRYLFITDFDEEINCFVLDEYKDTNDGDFFNPEDFNLYEENTNKDIKLLQTCELCGEHLTLMESINMDTDELYLVKRCLGCYSRPVEEVIKINL